IARSSNHCVGCRDTSSVWPRRYSLLSGGRAYGRSTSALKIRSAVAVACSRNDSAAATPAGPPPPTNTPGPATTIWYPRRTSSTGRRWFHPSADGYQQLSERSSGESMKAVTWHGKRDVRVEKVPDPKIEKTTDAIIEVTSTNICGSDLHLYEVLGA